MLVCPACQQAGDWTAPLDRCRRCASAHLIRRLGRVECLDCGDVRDPGPAPDPPARVAPGGDPALAAEVSRALDRLLRR